MSRVMVVMHLLMCCGQEMSCALLCCCYITEDTERDYESPSRRYAGALEHPTRIPPRA